MARLHHTVASAFLVGVLGLTSGGGCGGGSTQAQAPVAAAPAPKEVAELGINVHVEPSTHEAEPLVPNVTTALVSALSSAGYRVVEKDGKADVSAKVKVSATEKASLFKTQVNGKVKVDYDVQLSASFVSNNDAAVVDQATADFVSSEGAVDANAVNSLVSHLSSSGKLVAYATSQKAKVEGAEEDLWKAANVEDCRQAKSDKACDGVKAYIAKYASGKYTADGRKALSESETNARKNAEDAAWSAAAIDQCKKPTKSYDCKGVEDYLAKYPTGSHVAEAKDTMKASEKQRDTLRKSEEANKKKASYDDCVKDCRRAYADYRPAAFEILVNRCVQTECK